MISDYDYEYVCMYVRMYVPSTNAVQGPSARVLDGLCAGSGNQKVWSVLVAMHLLLSRAPGFAETEGGPCGAEEGCGGTNAEGTTHAPGNQGHAAG